MEYVPPHHPHFENEQDYEFTPAEIKNETEYKIEEEPIYVMKVELEEGKSQTIKIFSDSTPEELAFEFCKKNNLDISSMNYLASQIHHLLEELSENVDTREQEPIQEVDEEEYQNETRKINKSITHSQKLINHSSNKSIESEVISNYKRVKSNTQNKQRESNNTLSDLKENNSNSINTGNSVNTRNSANMGVNSMKRNSEKNFDNISRNVNNETENIIRESYDINETNEKLTKNEFLDTKELMQGKDDIASSLMNMSHNTNKTHNTNNTVPQTVLNTHATISALNDNNSEYKSKLIQKLFSYQMFTDNSKKHTGANTKSTTYHNNNTNSNTNNNNTYKKNINSFGNGSIGKGIKKIGNQIFDRLHRNAEHKKIGAYGSNNMRNNKPVNNYIAEVKATNASKTIVTNSSYTGQINNITNNNNSNIINNSCNQGKENFLNNSSEYSNKSRSRYQYRNGEVINFGERLYQKGIKLKEETQKRCEDYKRERDDFNSNNIFTFKPHMNEASMEINKKRSDTSVYDNENILRYNTYLDEKLEKLRIKHETRVEYSFSPNINRNSEKIANERLQARVLSRSLNNLGPTDIDQHKMRIDELYENFKLKQFKLNELTKQVYADFNYTPHVNSKFSEKEIMNLNFADRQEVFRQRSIEKMTILKRSATSPFDKSTGQSLFMPRVLNKSKSRDRITIDEKTNNMSVNMSRQHTSGIFQYLYSYAQKYTKNKNERQRDASTSIKKFSESIHTTNDSEFIFAKKKEDAFRRIYKLLDFDQDNNISSLNMDVRKLEGYLIKILKPIFEELKEENETLNENEFVRACEHLYEMLSFSDKRKLLEYNHKNQGSKKKTTLEYTFKPTIDKNSKRMAENRKVTYMNLKQYPQAYGAAIENKSFYNVSTIRENKY